MTKATVTAQNVDFGLWETAVDLDLSFHQNMVDMAEFAVSEVWGSLNVQFETAGAGIGYICVGSDVEETWAYFHTGDMVRDAIHEIVTNWHPDHHEEHVEEIRSHLQALKAQFEAAVRTIEEAISEPDRFTEPPDTSQNAADREEEIKYIKEMCGG